MLLDRDQHGAKHTPVMNTEGSDSSQVMQYIHGHVLHVQARAASLSDACSVANQNVCSAYCVVAALSEALVYTLTPL